MLALAALGAMACTAKPTAVELDFFAGQEVAQVRLIDTTNAENLEVLVLEQSMSGACNTDSRGSFVIQFPKDTERSQLALRAMEGDAAA